MAESDCISSGCVSRVEISSPPPLTLGLYHRLTISPQSWPQLLSYSWLSYLIFAPGQSFIVCPFVGSINTASHHWAKLITKRKEIENSASCLYHSHISTSIHTSLPPHADLCLSKIFQTSTSAMSRVKMRSPSPSTSHPICIRTSANLQFVVKTPSTLFFQMIRITAWSSDQETWLHWSKGTDSRHRRPHTPPLSTSSLSSHR